MARTQRKIMQNYLITGVPGVGKTTLLQKIINSIEKNRIKGVIVRELLNEEKRIGFEIESIEKKTKHKLATKQSSPADVGNYSIEQDGIDSLKEYLEILTNDEEQLDIVIFDEIGKMQYKKCSIKNFPNSLAMLIYF